MAPDMNRLCALFGNADERPKKRARGGAVPPHPSTFHEFHHTHPPSIHTQPPHAVACPCQAEKWGSMEFVKGGGASDEWSAMNTVNQRMMAAWKKSAATQVNTGRQIGVRMSEWIE